MRCFVAFTHNSKPVLLAANLFASVLFNVLEGQSITDALGNVEIDETLQDAFDAGQASKGQDSFRTIRKFGPACGIEGGFEGSIHLLCTYDDFREAMMANVKAGGDSAARGMVIGMLMGAAGKSVPDDWRLGITGLLKNLSEA